MFWDLTTAMWAGLAALFLRQIGHAVLEPPCHDKEALLLGYNTRNKTLILGTYLLIPAVYVAQASAWTAEALWPLVAPVAQAVFLWTALVVVGRVAYLVWRQGRAGSRWSGSSSSSPIPSRTCSRTRLAISRRRRRCSCHAGGTAGRDEPSVADRRRP